MATVATQNAPSLRTQNASSLLSSEMMVRFALVPLAVAICYCFEWRQLRFLTSEANLRLDLLAGISLQRLSYDTVTWKGALYRYENACTFVDVWFGCLPLLWHWGRGLIKNVLFFSGMALALFAFNVFRLSLSDSLFAAGLPWNVAHNVISGLAYFLVWVWVWRHRAYSAAI
jgi:hypothetical protein